MKTQHFVTFYSPGTFVPETTTLAIPEHDPKLAVKMSKSVVERYGARPFGFQFSTRQRTDEELDSKEIYRSGTFFIGGKLETREEIEARRDPKEEILRSNLRSNRIPKVWVSTTGWKTVQPFHHNDVHLVDV